MDNSENKVPVKDILDITIRNLSNIMVPVGLMQQIGVPIVQSLNNLKLATEQLASDEHAEEPREDQNEGSSE